MLNNISTEIAEGRKALRAILKYVQKKIQKTGPSIYFSAKQIKLFSELESNLDAVETSKRKLFYWSKNSSSGLCSRAVRDESVSDAWQSEPLSAILPSMIASNWPASRMFRVLFSYPKAISSIEIVSGKDIVRHYKKESGGKSCMTGIEQIPQTSFYAKHPSRVSLALVKEGTRYTARALLWTLDNGKQYLDRIYHINSSAYEVLDVFAILNGLQTHRHLPEFDEGIQITLGTKNLRQLFPFMDTFAYGVMTKKGLRLLPESKACQELITIDIQSCDPYLPNVMFNCPDCYDEMKLPNSISLTKIDELMKLGYCPSCAVARKLVKTATCLYCNEPAIKNGLCASCSEKYGKCKVCGGTKCSGIFETGSDQFPVPFICHHCACKLSSCFCCNVHSPRKEMKRKVYDDETIELCKKCAPLFSPKLTTKKIKKQSLT